MDLDFVDTWNFTIFEKGWTNDSTALVWLKNFYSPNKADERERERSLIIDSQKNHQTTKFLFECYSNNIRIVFLILHSFHVFQPFDVAVIGPVKNAYCKGLNKLT